MCLHGCGPRGIRTPDLLNAIETRSQLRYGPGTIFDFGFQIYDLHLNRKSPILIRKSVVDLRGFEPLTSSVRLRRAPNCATGPSDKAKNILLEGIGDVKQTFMEFTIILPPVHTASMRRATLISLLMRLFRWIYRLKFKYKVK